MKKQEKTKTNGTGILVTGANGYVGSNLCKLLLEQGANVIASDLASVAREDLRDKVKYVRADVGSFTSVLRLIETERPETIYHLGAMMAPACDANPEAGIQANALGTFYLLEAARLFGVRQMIFASTFAVLSGAYAKESVLDDFTVTRPDTVYGAAKLFSENLGLFYRRQYGFDYRCIRLPSIVGPGMMTHGFLEYFNKTIEESIKGNPYTIYVGPQTQIPIMHISDISRAFVELAAASKEKIKTANYVVLGPTPFPTAQELVDSVRAKIPGAKLDFKVNDQIQKLIDACVAPAEDSNAREEWGWKHRYDTDAMVDDFIDQSQPIRSKKKAS